MGTTPAQRRRGRALTLMTAAELDELTDADITARLLVCDVRRDHVRYLVDHRREPIVAERISLVLTRHSQVGGDA